MPRIMQLRHQTDTGDEATTTWVDLDLCETASTEWIEHQSDLPAHLVEHLLAHDEFSRREVIGDGLLVCFHTLAHKTRCDAIASDSMRIWIEKDRFITARCESSADCNALHAVAAQEPGNWAPFEILAYLVRHNAKQLEPLISDIVGDTGKLEDQLLEARDDLDDEQLNRIRTLTIRTRRHFVDLRDLLAFILTDESLPISQRERRALVSAKTHVIAYLESLEDCQERTVLLQAQIESGLADRSNKITLNLTIVATVILPLSFLTGLFGMNVTGIPDEHNPWAFTVVLSGHGSH